MALRWGGRAAGPSTGQMQPASAPVAAPLVAETCQMLGRALERVLKAPRPEILDLGSRCGESLVYLASRGARVTVGEINPPLPGAVARGAGRLEPAALPRMRIEAPENGFDLVLLWEWIDFVSPDRLNELGAEIGRRLNPGGLVLLLSLSVRTPGGNDHPRRYRLLSDREVRPEPITEVAFARYVHPTREIERAFAPLSLLGIHLQRSQIREVLLQKEAPRPESAEPEAATS